MINIFFCCTIFSINTSPQNIFMDHYTIVPPLGRISSIATSPIYVFAISDDYLLIFDKQNFNLTKTIYFDEEINLVGYDQQYNDLWISGISNIVRFTIASYSVREYPIIDEVDRFGISQDYLYLDGVRDYSLNKRTGELKQIHSFPDNTKWYKRITYADIKSYPFLTPYYYFDELPESQSPFRQFPITAIYDDGMELYVGTDGYGILKYNKISWQKKRVIYGPLDAQIRNAKKFDNKIYFISSLGISYYTIESGDWYYQRFIRKISDLLFFNNNFIIGFGNQLSQSSMGTFFTIDNMPTDILCLNSDDQYIYIGTNSGLFKIYKGTNESIPFGPDKYPVYIVYPKNNDIYVGGEFGFYSYNREYSKWTQVLSFGIKDIAEIKNALYLLSVNNQLIKYQNIKSGKNIDTNWVILPYFNIYDIDTDNEVLYCASYAGIHYFEPETELYKVVYNLPRIKYDYIFIIGDNISAVSRKNIYSLPIKYRD